MDVSIEREHPGSEGAIALIGELDAYLHSLYPPSACYGLSSEHLIQENVAFFVSRADGALAGCCGLKIEGTEYGEVKRMYVRPAYRGRGLARQMLRHLEEHAVKNKITLVRLETGKYQTEAIALYERAGYRRTAAFGRYGEDGFSLFFEKQLD